MSFIVSFKTNDFVAIAADKRTTYIEGTLTRFDDLGKKVHIQDGFIYALSGHVPLIEFYEKEIKVVTSFSDARRYTNKFFNQLDLKRQKDSELFRKMKLHIHLASIESRTELYVYQINPSEEGYLMANVPNTSEIPAFSAPALSDQEIIELEEHIKNAHPRNVEEADNLSKELIEKVSLLNDMVSKEYDFEYLAK